MLFKRSTFSVCPALTPPNPSPPRPCSKNNTGQNFVICDPEITSASLENGIVKLYSDLDDWRCEGNLRNALLCLRDHPLGLWSFGTLGENTSNHVVVQKEYFDALCEQLGGVRRRLNIALRLVGVFDQACLILNTNTPFVFISM